MSIIYVVPRPAGARDDDVRYVVSLTRNADCVFTIRAIDPDTKQPIDWNCDVWVFFVASNNGAQTKVAATVTGPDALVRIESDIGELIRDGAAWQAIRSHADQPSSLEDPLLVGSFVRSDGGIQGV
ncbi:hypothetical protein [[Mycobacterium] crassicus]|uniref:Uncharacterized protein n=1 Tax=[Mycobacterium] crassicus TaxID=2872309 RepID=A0ABU5XGD6_9MYCO|nr:hypothetical protein [Mycolicibacter sp. MYC098]MEB3021319.1 hypothetical protein [Mycolicibacter sp. MYC098]